MEPVKNEHPQTLLQLSHHYKVNFLSSSDEKSNKFTKKANMIINLQLTMKITSCTYMASVLFSSKFYYKITQIFCLEG
uniref:Uncharacterized protein n=1 Tax=Lotus japonicus TaxID=34305 RepID=I3SFD0_LOTJA|nr:unknown [Lotus japonicus]